VPLPKVFFLFQEAQKAIYLCRAEERSKMRRKQNAMVSMHNVERKGVKSQTT